MRLNKRSNSWWTLLVIMFALPLAVPVDAFAQKRGGSRRSSTRRSTPKRSAPKAPSRAKPKASTKRGGKTGEASNKGKFGSSTKKAGKSKKATKADKKVREKAKANGTYFKDRKSASADFKTKNAAKYGSTYATKPTTRPGHIPPTYVGSGGTTYNISYNQGYGGYGYMGPLGTWMVYNAMADAAMGPYYNRQMASAGYDYGPPLRPLRHGPSGGTIFFFIAGGVVVLFVISGVLKGKA